MIERAPVAAPPVASGLVRARAARVAGAAFPVAVAALLAGFAALLLWNVARYPWLRGFDAGALSQYVHVVREGRLPAQEETTVWHNPPLFFALAAGLQGVAGRLGLPRQETVQVASAAFAVGVAALAFLVARELFPRSRLAQLGALGLAVSTPVLARAGVMYHPEAMSAFLAAAATFVVVRALARGRIGIVPGALAGGLAGLASLTRTWGLAAAAGLLLALVLHRLLTRERAALAAAAAFAVAVALLTGPWLAYKTAVHGSPLAYSKPVPAEWTLEGRPAAFYVSFPVREVFGSPYAPHSVNRLLPVTYADWWGDYWRYYGVPVALIHEPPRLPDAYHRPRVLQSFVGVIPSALVLAGIAGLGVQAVRRRSAAHAAVLGPLVLLGGAFVWFLAGNPKLDGDNIKALYVLNAALPAAVAGGWALARLGRAGLRVLAPALLLLLAAAAVNIRFLLLPPA
jgi:hypothetical protein